MKNNKGFAAIEGLLILLIVAILGFTGWYVYKARNNTNMTLNNANAANSSSVKYSKETPADEYVGWKEYCSKAEGSCFKYPANWTAEQTQTQNPDNKDAYNFISPSGTQLQWSSEVGGIGGACDINTEPHVYIHQVNELPKVSGLYLVSSGTTNPYKVQTIGLMKEVSDKKPVTGDTGFCGLYTLFNSKDNKRTLQLAAQNFNEANNTSFQKDTETINKILLSYHY